MNLRGQLALLVAEGVEFVVVGGQAGVLRQAIEFSHDLDVLIRRTPENAERVRVAVEQITHVAPDPELVLGRDFQQYVDLETGTEIDVHLTLIGFPDHASALRNASNVDVLGLVIPVLELPALYASKRTDRPRDAVHRLAIEARLRHLLLDRRIEPDEVVLACCLDAEIARLPSVADRLAAWAAGTEQPMLQARLLALGSCTVEVAANPKLHATPRAILALDASSRAKLLDHPARLAALLSRVPLVLPEAGYRLQWLL